MSCRPSFSIRSTRSYQVITSYLNALTSFKPYILSVFIYVDNPHGQYLSSLDGLARIPESRDTKWFDELMAYDGPPSSGLRAEPSILTTPTSRRQNA